MNITGRLVLIALAGTLIVACDKASNPGEPAPTASPVQTAAPAPPAAAPEAAPNPPAATPPPAPEQKPHPIIILNASHPGADVDLATHVQAGHWTFVDFYADWCGPCKTIAPMLEKLAQKDPNVQILKVNIGNWGSPVVKRFQINSVPSFWIFDKDRKLAWKGEEARQRVYRILEELEKDGN